MTIRLHQRHYCKYKENKFKKLSGKESNFWWVFKNRCLKEREDNNDSIVARIDSENKTFFIAPAVLQWYGMEPMARSWLEKNCNKYRRYYRATCTNHSNFHWNPVPDSLIQTRAAYGKCCRINSPWTVFQQTYIIPMRLTQNTAAMRRTPRIFKHITIKKMLLLLGEAWQKMYWRSFYRNKLFLSNSRRTFVEHKNFLFICEKVTADTNITRCLGWQTLIEWNDVNYRSVEQSYSICLEVINFHILTATLLTNVLLTSDESAFPTANFNNKIRRFR